MFAFRKKEPTAQQKVDKLSSRTEAALSAFTDAVHTLCSIVDDANHTISVNELTIAHLENCNTELRQAVAKNTNIINNFNRLLNGDTETTN